MTTITPSLYNTFGSFSSPSVEYLISQSDIDYIPPINNIIFPELPIFKYEDFGRLCKDNFILDNKWIFINQGAFGSPFKIILELAYKYTLRMELQPLRYIDRELLPLLVDSTRILSKYVNCKPINLVLIQNVTLGLNAIFKSLAFKFNKPDDKILRLDLAYGSVKKMLNYYMPNRTIEVVIKLPLTTAAVINRITETLQNDLNKNIKVIVIDHVTSNSAVVLPVKEIVTICKKYGVISVVDGAHSLGALDLDLINIDADFYVSNAHKWFGNPKGCGFLYANSKLIKELQPFIISHGSGVGYHSDFIWTGAQDYCNFLTIPFLTKIWEANGTLMRKYIYELLSWAIDYLLNEWQTELLAEKSMYRTMATIKIPGPNARDKEEHNRIQDALFASGIEVPIKRFGDVMYVRISAYIYNSKSDYERLAKVMLDLRFRSNI